MIRPDPVIVVFADHPSSEPAVKKLMADGFAIKCFSIVAKSYNINEKVGHAKVSYSTVFGQRVSVGRAGTRCSDPMTPKNAAASVSSHPTGHRPAMLALTFLGMAGVMIASFMQPAAGQSKAPDNAPIQSPNVSSAPANQGTFRSHVHDEMADWKLKIQTFNDRTEASGKHEISAAEAGLRHAWDNTEVKARNVQAASAREWEQAEQSYEAAIGDLKKAWDKAQL